MIRIVFLFLLLWNVFGDESGLDFLVMGDWGGQDSFPYYTTAQVQTAKTMGEIAEKHSSDFVLALGDNFYESGVTSKDDERFEATFENIFSADSLSNIPFYVIAGNHDWKGSVDAQIEYTKISKNNRWQFESYYYSKTFNIENTDYTLQIIMIDTNILCGSTVDSTDYCTQENGFVNGINSDECTLIANGPEDDTSAINEWIFLYDQLSSSNADFLIVAGHYPVWSVAEHGPTKQLVDQLRPMLLEFDVTLFLSGHDHTMEYLEELDINTGYVVTGAVHKCDTSLDNQDNVPQNSLLYHDCQNGGFVRVHIDNNGLTVNYYLSDSNEITYKSKTFLPRNKNKDTWINGITNTVRSSKYHNSKLSFSSLWV